MELMTQLRNKLPPDTEFAQAILGGCLLLGHEMECAITEASKDFAEAML